MIRDSLEAKLNNIFDNNWNFISQLKIDSNGDNRTVIATTVQI